MGITSPSFTDYRTIFEQHQLHEGEMVLPLGAHVTRPVKPVTDWSFTWKCGYCTNTNSAARLLCITCGAPRSEGNSV